MFINYLFILCKIIISNKSIRYIPDAKAKTDAPDLFGEFMLQRRRWINGSNFAIYYVFSICCRVCNTNHKIRQIFILFLFLYYFLQTILSFLILGTFYFVYYMICVKNFGTTSIASSIIMSIYLFIIVITMIASFSLKPNRVKIDGKVFYENTTIYKILSFILGIYNVAAFIFGIITIFVGGLNPTIKPCKGLSECYDAYKEYLGALYLSVIGLCNFFLPLIIEPSMICTWFNNFIQYLFFQPTYAIVLNIFAACNIDDVSWGNRDSNGHKAANNFKKYKITYLILWLILNFILGWGFSYIVTTPNLIINGTDKLLINIYSFIVAILTTIKFICFVIGKFKYILIDKKCRKLLVYDEQKTKNKNSLKSNLNELKNSNSNQEINKIEKEPNNNIINEHNSINNKINLV